MSSPLDGERLRSLLGFAHELADLADGITRPAFGRVLAGERAVDRKADGTIVTAADRETERTIRTRIRGRFPDHAVLGEEDGLDGPDDAPCWIVDPIDGTSNFAGGNPIFATLIALRVDGAEVLGVVSAPALGSRWDGMRGGPAHQDGREIRVSDTRRLADAEVAFGGLGYFEEKGYGGLLPALAAGTRRQRGYGDFWQHCLVAAGSTDVAIEAEVNLWDLAAVKAVVEAAGGRFTSFEGVDTADGGTAISSNGRLHAEVLDLLASSSTG